MPRVVLLCRHIGHYHHARYVAATEAGIDLHVIAITDDADFRELLHRKPQSFDCTVLYSTSSEYRKATRAGDLAIDLGNALNRLAPTAIAVSGWAFPESYRALIWANRHKRTVVVMSETNRHDSKRFAPAEYIKRKFVAHCSAALVGGTAHSEYIASLGMPPERIFFGYDAVDNGYFETRCAETRLANKAGQTKHLPNKYILASGRMIPKKNFTALVEAFAAATPHDETVHLVILGDGPERPVIEQLSRALGVQDRVHLPGFQSYEKLPEYYAHAEFFVHVATTEQWGLVVNEAAASGLPLIVSKSSGASEVVQEGVNGFVVDGSSVRSIAAAISQMLALPAEERAAMGLKSARLIHAWGPQQFAAGLKGACDAPNRVIYKESWWENALFSLMAHVEPTNVP